jgi:cyanophycinase
VRVLTGIAILLVLVSSADSAVSGEIVKQGNGWVYNRLGNPKDIKTRTQFGIFFGGGGTDVDAGFRWMCTKSANGDFLVIRATGTDAYNPYIYGLCPGINSVSTLKIESRAAAGDPFVKATILNAEALFISGGDQANYLNFWQGTPVQDAINTLAARNVPVGGTSAGNAVLAHYSFSALHDTVTSQQALSDPFTSLITIDDRFLNLSPLLRNTITDDHFVIRDRMGRLVTFLARILHEDGHDDGATPVSAIAIGDRTAFLMEPDGSGTVVGSGSVYFVRIAKPAEVLRARTPLTAQGISVHRIEPGSTFNITTWRGTQGVIYSISAVNGSLQSTQPGGGIY